MDVSGTGVPLAERLRQLKARSGRSYAELARKAFISSSSLHRYCTGQGYPPDADTVARIARACGATKAEEREILAAWLSAAPPPPADGADGADVVDVVDGPDAVAVAVTAAVPPGPPAAERSPGPEPDPSPSPVGASPVVPPGTRRLRFGFRPGASTASRTIATACVLAVLSLVLSSAARPEAASHRGLPQWISGPSWVRAPVAVSSRRFGVTINSDTGQMPAFRTGAVRFWDSGTRWSEIESRRGAFDWSTLDRLVGGARRAGLPALFVLGGTPGWAAPAAPKSVYPDGSRAAAPDRLADWDTFVRKLVTRYRGKMEGYELWPVGNDRRFFAGGPAALVELTRRAARVIRKTDPKAIVVCPGMGRLWDTGGRTFMRRFAELGGYGYCDVASVKLHQRDAADPPETMLQILREADRTLHAAGVQPPVWSTGTTYDIVLQRPLDEERAVDYAVRFYLTGLYGLSAELERSYFYAWGNTKVPVVLQAVEGAPTKAALAVEEFQRWLDHARIRACGHGLPAGLPANVWQCEFLLPSAQGAPHAAVVRWTDIGTAETTVPATANVLRRLDGSRVRVRPGGPAPVGPRPVLFDRE